MKLLRSLVLGCIAITLYTSLQSAVSNKPTELSFTIHTTDTDVEHATALLFAHGIASSRNQVLHHFARYTSRNIDGSYNSNRYWLFDQPIATFNFPDSQSEGQFNKTFVNLGQQLDQECLDYAYKQTLQELPLCTKIIGSGISRGAVTWLNYAAEKRPAELGALVLESPFEGIKSIVSNLLRRFRVSWIPFSTKLSIWAIKKKFPALNMNGPFPLDLVDQIDKELPIFMVHSRSDQVIPNHSCRKLYIKLVQSGHNHVYLLELARGEHGKLIQGMEGELYQNCVHAFLQNYDLPHCAEFAQRGRSLLAMCQPSVQEVQKWLKQKRSIPLDLELEEYDTPTFAIDDQHGTIKLIIDNV